MSCKISYYQKPEGHGGNEVKVELDLSNYVTKADLKEEQVLIHLI